MIDASRVNVVREALKSLEELEGEEFLSNITALVKGKCVLVLLSQ
jgi:hypothetical protein